MRGEVLTAGRAISPLFHLRAVKTGVSAQAQQVDGEFFLRPGSCIVATWQGVAGTQAVERHYATHAARFQSFVGDGSIEIRAERGRVVRCIPFTSPPAAGAVATGRSCNGRRQWVTDDGTTFDAWEARDLDSVTTEPPSG